MSRFDAVIRRPPEPPLEESDEFLELFDEFEGPLDYDAVLGLMHAVASAPSGVAPELWLDCVLGSDEDAPALPKAAEQDSAIDPSQTSHPHESERNHESREKDAQRDQLRAGLRQEYEAVKQALREGSAFIPEDDEVEAWGSFAQGYVLGAALDASWINDPERWALVSWFAYLAGRRDAVAPELLEELDADPSACDIICDKAPALIRAIYAEFQQPSQLGRGQRASAREPFPRLGSAASTAQASRRDTRSRPASGKSSEPGPSKPGLSKPGLSKPNAPSRIPFGTGESRSERHRSGSHPPGRPPSGRPPSGRPPSGRHPSGRHKSRTKT